MPEPGDLADHIELAFDVMDDEVFLHAIRLGRAGNVVQVIVGNGRSNDIKIFIVNRVMHQPYIE